MSSSIAYALGALLLYGLADFVYKRGAAAGAQPHQFLMVQTWFFSSLALAWGLISGTLAFHAASLWGAAAGVLVVVGYYNFAWSLKHGSVSTNATIFRLSFAVTAVLAVLVLGEPLTDAKLAGLALALVAVWLLLAPRDAGAPEKPEDKASLGRVLVATLAVGVASFTYKLGLVAGAAPIDLVVAQGAVAVTLATTFAARLDGGIRPSHAALRHAPVAAVLLVVAFIFLGNALRGGEASIIVPIAQMGFVVTAVLGFLLLREPFTLRKGAGLAAAAVALASLGMSAS
ncbi:MAG TPA: EamA family transporter [Burkholderiales bacterium]|nr:EamA family transporter [Burkholderiales bacterium]